MKRIFTMNARKAAVLAAAGMMAVGISSTALAANGSNWVVGVLTNSATATTRLVGTFDGSTLILSNTSTGATATPLELRAGAGRPALKVNTTAKIANLNGDQLDSLDGSAYQSRTAMAIGGIVDTTSGGGFGVPLTAPVSITVPAGQNFILLAATATFNDTNGTTEGDYVMYWALDANCTNTTGYATAAVFDSVTANPTYPQSSSSMNFLFHVAPGPHTVTVCGLSDTTLQAFNSTVLLQTAALNGTGGTSFSNNFKNPTGGKLSTHPGR